MTALVWPRIGFGATTSRPWRRCAALSLATATLVVVVGLVALALGWSWPDAGAVGVGGVGTWTLATATTGLRQVFTGRSAELQALAQVVPGLGLTLNVMAVALAQALGGPALVVLGCVDVVVANLVVGAAAALEARR